MACAGTACDMVRGPVIQATLTAVAAGLKSPSQTQLAAG